MRLSYPAPLLVLAVAMAGCFDVDSGPAPLLIDNFDNGGVLPLDHHFDQWRCGIFPPQDYQDCQCGYDDGTFHSYPNSIFLYAVVKDTLLIGGQDYGGAQLYTQAVVPEDLSHRTQLVFSAKFDQDLAQSTIPYTPTLYVELHCSLASDSDASMTKDVLMHAQVQDWQSPGWKTFALALSQFDLPYDAILGRPSRATACLEHVDSIHFSVNTQLQDGNQGAFHLNLDDIYFR